MNKHVNKTFNGCNQVSILIELHFNSFTSIESLKGSFTVTGIVICSFFRTVYLAGILQLSIASIHSGSISKKRTKKKKTLNKFELKIQKAIFAS